MNATINYAILTLNPANIEFISAVIKKRYAIRVTNIAISCKELLKLPIDKGMKKQGRYTVAGINHASIAKFW